MAELLSNAKINYEYTMQLGRYIILLAPLSLLQFLIGSVYLQNRRPPEDDFRRCLCHPKRLDSLVPGNLSNG